MEVTPSPEKNTKVDISATYNTCWVAKYLAKAGLCRKCLVQVSYAINIHNYFFYGNVSSAGFPQNIILCHNFAEKQCLDFWAMFRDENNV